MNIQEAKGVLNRVNNAKRFDGIYTSIDVIFEAISIILAELDNKDKIINEMADSIYLLDSMSEYGNTRQEVIDYFTKKVSE